MVLKTSFPFRGDVQVSIVSSWGVYRNHGDFWEWDFSEQWEGRESPNWLSKWVVGFKFYKKVPHKRKTIHN